MQLIPDSEELCDKVPSSTLKNTSTNMEVSANLTACASESEKLSQKDDILAINGICEDVSPKENVSIENMEIDQFDFKEPENKTTSGVCETVSPSSNDIVALEDGCKDVFTDECAKPKDKENETLFNSTSNENMDISTTDELNVGNNLSTASDVMESACEITPILEDPSVENVCINNTSTEVNITDTSILEKKCLAIKNAVVEEGSTKPSIEVEMTELNAEKSSTEIVDVSPEIEKHEPDDPSKSITSFNEAKINDDKCVTILSKSLSAINNLPENGKTSDSSNYDVPVANKTPTADVDTTFAAGVDKISTDDVDTTFTAGVDKISTDDVATTFTARVDKISTDNVDKISTDSVDKMSIDDSDKNSLTNQPLPDNVNSSDTVSHQKPESVDSSSNVSATKSVTNDITNLQKTITSETLQADNAEIIPNADESIVEKSNAKLTTNGLNNETTKSSATDMFDVLISDEENDGSKKSKNSIVQDQIVAIDDDDDIVLINDSVKDVQKGNLHNVSTPLSKFNELPSPGVSTKAASVEESTKCAKTNEVGKSVNETDEIISPLNFMKSITPSLGEMSRADLEEFCVVKIVEGIAGRSALSDIRLKLKAYEKSMEEWRKKVISLNKQNKDLQIVLKTVSEEQQKREIEKPTPIKITRSVGLQVGFPTVKPASRQQELNTSPEKTNFNSTDTNTPSLKRGRPSKNGQNNPTTSPVSNAANVGIKIAPKKTNTVPIPRLVPTNSPSPKSPKFTPKILSNSTPNNSNNSSLLKTVLSQTHSDQKQSAEKRPAIQSIDLTDDEPPAKQSALKVARAIQSTIRPVNSQQLTNPNRITTTYVMNNPAPGPRPVYIPISAQGQSGVNSVGPRKILGNKTNSPIRNFSPQGNQVMRFGQAIPIRPNSVYYQHPAPLPNSVNPKILMSPGLKWIPPRPSLKIARVDNGIVISWEMEDFSEAQHESIASYQIYAYQEAATQPSTDLWKKIGDVKALPLPMACTLTHFMAGFKYYFAVRAIDVHRRIGPFSAPGNIMLINNKSAK